MRLWKVMFGLGFLPAAGCSSAVAYRENSGWNTPAAYTTADTRIVTQRPHPLSRDRQVICTEPSPDVAKALSTAAQLAGSGGSGTVNASLTASAASASAVAELAGRSTALLGLRDGLYRACEAYANGALGDSAYALVLSRYGQIMTTLFLGQDADGAGAGWTPATAQAPAAPLPSAPAPTKPAAGSAAGTTANGSAPQQSLVRPVAWLAAIPALAVQQPPTRGATTSGKPGAATQGVAPDAASTSVADAIRRMQQQYFDLNKDPLSILLVECVNEADPTRPGALVREVRQDGTVVHAYANDLLMGPNGMCNRVMSLVLQEVQARLRAMPAAQGAGGARRPAPVRR